jgi:hypothetical protein
MLHKSGTEAMAAILSRPVASWMRRAVRVRSNRDGPAQYPVFQDARIEVRVGLAVGRSPAAGPFPLLTSSPAAANEPGSSLRCRRRRRQPDSSRSRGGCNRHCKRFGEQAGKVWLHAASSQRDERDSQGQRVLRFNRQAGGLSVTFDSERSITDDEAPPRGSEAAATRSILQASFCKSGGNDRTVSGYSVAIRLSAKKPMAIS